MAQNLDFLSILAGLDVNDSTQNIQKQLQQISRNLKGVKIPLEVDTKTIQKAMKQMPKDMAFDDNMAEGKSLLLNNIKEMYKGQAYEVGKVVSELHKQTVRAEVLINRLDGTISKETVAVSGKYDKETKGVDWSQPSFMNFGTDEAIKASKATQDLTKELSIQGREINKLQQIALKRQLTTEEQALLTYREVSATDKLASHMAMLNSVQKQGLISEQKYLELTHQVAVAKAQLDSQMSGVDAQQKQIDKIEEANRAYQEYKHTIDQIKIYESMERKGTLVDTKDIAKYQELQNAANAYYNRVISGEIDYVEKAQRTTEMYHAQKTKYKQSDEYQAQVDELKKIRRLKNEIIAIDEKRQKFKLSSASLGFTSEGGAGEDPVVTDLRNKKQILKAEFDKQFESIKNNNPFPDIVASIEDMNTEMEEGIAKNKQLLGVLQAQREAKIKDKYFSGAPVMTTELGAGKPSLTEQQLKTFKGLNTKELFADTEAMENLTYALGGHNAMLKKNITTTQEMGQTLHHFTITVDTDQKHVRDLTYTFREFKDENNNTQREIYKTNEALRVNANRMLGVWEMLKLTFKRMATWALMGQLVYGAIRKIGEGFRWLLDINKELVQSAIVQGVSLSSTNKQLAQYIALGQQMGIPALEIAKVTTELQRQGLSLEESKVRMQTILKLSATGMTTVAQAMQTVTTAVNALGVAHDKAADIILKASMISASDVEGIGEALSKTASSASAAGLSIEQTTGIMAGLIQVTQEGSSQIGNSLKTILARFNAINEETGEYNQELNKIHTALKTIGVEYLTADGQIRNTYDVLKDTAAIWNTLTKNQQAYIATVGAGVRMQSRFYAIMQNFDTIDNFVNTLYDSEGTLADSFETQLTGYEAKLNKARASLEGIWANIMPPDLMETIINILSDFTSGLNTFLTMVNKIPGSVSPVFNMITSTGLTVMSAFRGKLGKTFTELSKGALTFNEALGQTLSMSMRIKKTNTGFFSVFKTNFATIKADLLKSQNTIGLASVQTRALAHNFINVKAATQATALSLTAVNIQMQKLLLAVASFSKKLFIMVALQAVIGLAHEFFTGEKALQAMNERLDETITKLEAIRAGALESANTFAEYEKLSNKKGAFTSDEQQQFYDVSNKIAELAPTLVTEYDEMGNAILTSNISLDSFNEALKEQQKLFNMQYRSNFSEQYKKLSKELEKTTSDLEGSQKAIESLMKGDNIDSRLAEKLGLTGTSTGGALIQDKMISSINPNATPMQRDMLNQRLQSMKAANDKIIRDKQLQMWRQSQPVISSIGEDAGLAAEGMKALQIATRGLDVSSLKTLRQYEGAVTNTAIAIKENEQAFTNIFGKYDILKEKMKDGELSTQDFNIEVEKIRAELEKLLTTLDIPVDSNAIVKALEAIIDQKEGLATLIDRLTVLKGRLGVYDDFASQVADMHEAFRETGDINFQSLMEAVEASDGMLTMEQLIRNTQEEKLGILDSTVAKMYEAVKAEKELQLAQAKTIRDEKQKAYDLNPNADTHAELLAAKKDIAYIQTELSTAMDGLLNSFDIQGQAGAQFDYITEKLQDFNKYLEDYNENKSLSGSNMQEIITKYPELIGLLGDEQSMREELADLIAEEDALQRKALARKLEATETFYKNNRQIYINIFKNLAEQYGLDVENFRSTQQAKLEISAEVQKRIAKLNASINVGTTTESVQQNIADLKKQNAELNDNMLAKILNGGKIKKNNEAITELQQYKETLEAADKVAENVVAKIDLSPINTSIKTKKDKKSGSQQFVEILRVLPRYASKLDDLANSYEKATSAHEKLFKRISADKYFATNHTAEYFTAQVASMQELYSLQGKALAQQTEIKKIADQAAIAYKKQTGLQADASNAEASYLNWKQIKETAIHNLTQKQKFIANETTKNAYAERIKAIQHEIALADYHRNAWEKATTQLDSLNDKWWELFSSMQSTMEELTNTTIEKIGKFKEAMVEAIQASRGEFGRYNRVDDIHQLDLLMLDLRKLQKQFVSTSGSFNPSSLSNGINKVDIDTRALLNTINALNDERKRIMDDKTLSEVDKQEMLNELVEKQIKLEKELDKEKQHILEKLNAMELEHRAIENAMQNRIELKEDELKALQKQKQLEEKIRQEQQKQLDLLRAMDDTRFSYITGLGEEIFTYDRSKLKDLESNMDSNGNDTQETLLQEEIDKMNEQLNEYKEANRIAEETLRILLGINDNLFSTLSSDIDALISSLEQVFEQMTEKLTNNIGTIFDKWYEAQSKKDTKTAKDILNVYKSMDSLMKALFKQSLPKLDSFDTGGYTGNWSGSDGKLAMVHQKELVLNETDTSNILAAINALKNFNFTEMGFNKPASVIGSAITTVKEGLNIYLQNPRFVTENANTFGKDMQALASNTLSRMG